MIQGLSGFAVEQKINGASFTAIGASGEVILSYYNLTEKKYEDHILKEEMEIVSVTGNIAWMKNTPVIHAHGVFADKGLTTRGGHIKKLIVSATCEVSLFLFDEPAHRCFDETTGLNLLQ